MSSRSEPKQRTTSAVNSISIVISAAVVAEGVTFPLDLIKTKLQLQGDNQRSKFASPNKNYEKLSYFKTLKVMYKQHGLKSFYNGLSPGLLRHFIYSGVRVPFYEYSRNYYMSTIGKNRQVVSVQYPNSHQTYPPSIPGKPRKSKIPAGLTLPEASLLAGFSGSLGQFFASPTDLLKVRLQSGEAKTFIQAYKSVPNFTSFWKGSTPNIMRAFFVNQGDLMTYDKLKKSLLTNTTLQEGTVLHFICSFGAGLVACSLALPFDTVKTRIMNQPIDSTGQGKYYRNMRHAFYVMVKNEGLFSLYRGFFAAWPRMALWSQCFWHANENIRAIFDLPPF